MCASIGILNVLRTSQRTQVSRFSPPYPVFRRDIRLRVIRAHHLLDMTELQNHIPSYIENILVSSSLDSSALDMTSGEYANASHSGSTIGPSGFQPSSGHSSLSPNPSLHMEPSLTQPRSPIVHGTVQDDLRATMAHREHPNDVLLTDVWAHL